MYVATFEGLGQVQRTSDLGRVARLNHWHNQPLGQQPTPTTGAGTTASKGNDVVGGPVLLDRFDVGEYRLKPRHYGPLINLAKQVRDKAGSVRGLMLLIEGYADDTGARLMNSGLSFNRALEVKRFLTEAITHISNNKVSLPMRLSGKGEKSPIPGAPKSKNRRVEVRLISR
jgi:outer membrane protein OmpA-like peptidoglycan-associated protein